MFDKTKNKQEEQEEEPEEEETYEVPIRCSNCGAEFDKEIKKGNIVDDILNKLTCEDCGVTGLLKKNLDSD